MLEMVVMLSKSVGVYVAVEVWQVHRRMKIEYFFRMLCQ